MAAISLWGQYIQYFMYIQYRESHSRLSYIDLVLKIQAKNH